MSHEPLKIPTEREALLRMAFAESDGCVSVGGLAAKVAAIESRHDEVIFLCSEMISTLLMDRNAPYIHEKLREIAIGWRDRFSRIDPRGACEHGVPDKEYCAVCNKEYKRAEAANGAIPLQPTSADGGNGAG